MSKNLVIVESPAKVKTISKYLGDDFEVTLNVKTLIDTFTDNFKQNYSTWVSTEASKLKNKK